VLGPGRTDGLSLEFATVAMRLRIDGAQVADTAGGATTEAVLGALVWLANHAAARNGGLKAGQIVITGARLGPVPITGSTAEAEVEGLGTVSLTLQPGD
jgi:2-keto-4-pentenoate hydratase